MFDVFVIFFNNCSHSIVCWFIVVAIVATFLQIRKTKRLARVLWIIIATISTLSLFRIALSESGANELGLVFNADDLRHIRIASITDSSKFIDTEWHYKIVSGDDEAYSYLIKKGLLRPYINDGKLEFHDIAINDGNNIVGLLSVINADKALVNLKLYIPGN